LRLLQARDKLGGGSFAEIGKAALGPIGEHLVNMFLVVMQIGVVNGLLYFIIISLKDILQEITRTQDISIFYFGKISDNNH
jgi:hypothetical protein